MVARVLHGLGVAERDLEVLRGARAVVVDARALEDGVQVRADDDGAIGVARSGRPRSRCTSSGSRRTSMVVMWTVTSPAPASPASSSPTSKLVPIAGMPTGPPSVPDSVSVRPGWPSLKITTAAAPASWAFAAFSPNVQVPRWTSATAPAGKPAKSASSQPLVFDEGSAPGRQHDVDRNDVPGHVTAAGELHRREVRRRCRCAASERCARTSTARAPGRTGTRTAGR